MRKLLLISFLMFTMFSMAACSSSDNEPAIPEQPETPGGNDNEEQPDTPSPDGSARCLVLYASRSGNTERMAEEIRRQLDCDMLEIEPQTPYDDDYNAMLSRSQEELDGIRRGHYPPVKNTVKSFDDYDMIFVGYPIWYGSMATPMQTFLHDHATKLAGKRIALFASSGSSGISTSIGEARKLCPGATVIEHTLLLTSSTLIQMKNRIKTWLEDIGVSKEEQDMTSLKVNITLGDRTITATMEDNASGRDLISRLPLEVTLNDYNNTTEKIFYPTSALTTEGVTRGCTPKPGDITIYAPWGNVAIFCKSWSHSNDLIRIGRIDGNGIEALTVGGDIRVKIEKQ